MAEAKSLQDVHHVILEVTIKDFQTKERDELHSMSKVIEATFSQKVRNKLIALGYDKDELDEVTDEVLKEGVEIYENSDHQSQDILDLNALEELHSDLCDRAVMIVHLCKDLTSAKVAIEVPDDIVCELYPDIRHAPEKNKTSTVQVPSYLEMKQAFHKFITGASKHAKKMVLVFHAETYFQELEDITLKDEPQQPGMESLYIGSKRILEIYTTAWESESVQLPQAMDIVLLRQHEIDIIHEDSGGKKKIIVKPLYP